MNASKQPPRGALRGCLFLLGTAIVFGGALMFTPVPKKVYRGLLRLAREMRSEPATAPAPQQPAPTPDAATPPPPPPEPEPPAWSRYEDDPDIVVRDIIAEIKAEEPPVLPWVNYKSIDTARLWSGVESRTEVLFSDGGAASLLREEPLSYHLDLKIRVTVPEPVDDLEGLAASNGHLPSALPGLAAMLSPDASPAVSTMYRRLYDIKTKRVQQFVTRLNAIPDRHNFYDCETILTLTHPDTGQKVFLIHGDMDVVSDGSDGDRMPEYDEYIATSQHYQPFTSYGWPKKTRQPNPLLERWEKKVADAEAEIAAGKVRSSQVASVRASISTWKREIADMKGRSCLIARADPFIVVPVWMRGAANPGEPFAPDVGDYAAVVFEDRIYPAIVGDTGPTWKVGEASLRIAKEINERSSPYNRPVSKLHVSYLIFPDSRDKPDAPDLARWRAEVSEHLDRIGGLGEGYTLHEWSDYFAPPEDAPEQEGADAGAEGSAAAATSGAAGAASDGASP